MSTWHYLPVYTQAGDEREYTICEVYLDDDRRVEAWTADPAMVVGGSSPTELAADLQHMLDALARWQPVAFTSLTVGMTLTPCVNTS